MSNPPQESTKTGKTRILLATGNPAKQATLQWLLEDLPLETVTPGELGLTSVPDEEGETHQAIARQKATAWSRAASMLVIASDGGLIIPALGANWESRFTHRFAGASANDQDRLRVLLELMRPYRGADREASWVESVAIAAQGQILTSWELAGATGLIADVPREDSGEDPAVEGFWVFSVWRFPKFGKYYNQLTETERISLDDHWTQLRAKVQSYFQKEFQHLSPPSA